jgi:hypothetical protein
MDDQTGKSAKGRARQTVSDKRQLSGPSMKRKKTNMNIRTAILYRKNFATLIEESVSGTYTLFPGGPVYSHWVRESLISLPRYRLTLPPLPHPLRSPSGLFAPSAGIGESINARNVLCHFVVSIAGVYTMKRDVNGGSSECGYSIAALCSSIRPASDLESRQSLSARHASCLSCFSGTHTCSSARSRTLFFINAVQSPLIPWGPELRLMTNIAYFESRLSTFARLWTPRGIPGRPSAPPSHISSYIIRLCGPCSNFGCILRVSNARYCGLRNVFVR